MKSKKNKPLQVGFDLDGVLLYNPARVVRPLLKSGKSIFLRQKETKFYVPSSKRQIAMWKLAHKSSLFIAPGFGQIKDLVEKKQIEAYIVTARFECLKQDYQNWLGRLNRDQIFTQSYYNQHNQQPHQFKEEMIDKLNLDLFVEDNWDIVDHLNQTSIDNSSLKRVLWVSNIFDKPIPYPYKYNSLSSAMKAIKNYLNQS